MQNDFLHTTGTDNTLMMWKEGIAFIGMKDPWSDVDEVNSRKPGSEEYRSMVYEDANHSLETGQVIQDLDILKDVMIKTNNYLSVEKH